MIAPKFLIFKVFRRQFRAPFFILKEKGDCRVHRGFLTPGREIGLFRNINCVTMTHTARRARSFSRGIKVYERGLLS